MCGSSLCGPGRAATGLGTVGLGLDRVESFANGRGLAQNHRRRDNALASGAGQIKVVATGLFPQVRTAMDQNLVHFALHQRMAEQGELAVQQLHDLLSGHPPETLKILVPPLIAMRSNIDLLAARLPVPGQPAEG